MYSSSLGLAFCVLSPVASGVMPLRVSSRRFSSYSLRRVVVACLLVVLQWLETVAGSGAAATTLSIKLACCSLDRGGEDSVLPLSGHRGGGEDGELRSALALCRSLENEVVETAVVFGSIFSVVLCRASAGSPSTFLAEGQLLRALVLVAWYQLPYSLLAVVPYGRPYSSFSAGGFVGITPSGVVPGGGVDARASKLKIDPGGEGPDGVPLFCFEVLYAKVEDHIAISLFCEVHPVKCNPTAEG